MGEKKTYYVYLIPFQRRGKTCYYTGYTNNPQRRYAQHAAGNGARCLRGKKLGPMGIIYTCGTQKHAMGWERYIKKGIKGERRGLTNKEKRKLYEKCAVRYIHEI